MDAAGFDPRLPLDATDQELVAAARDVILRHHRPFWHTIAAAMRGRDGRIWTGLHLGATVGRLSICAEAVALGRAILEGAGDIVATVAVRHPKPDEAEREPTIVPPCGACLDMLADHAPGALVIVPGPAAPGKMPVRALLPLPYRR
jgi:cytidine deaminase